MATHPGLMIEGNRYYSEYLSTSGKWVRGTWGGTEIQVQLISGTTYYASFGGTVEAGQQVYGGSLLNLRRTETVRFYYVNLTYSRQTLGYSGTGGIFDESPERADVGSSVTYSARAYSGYILTELSGYSGSPTKNRVSVSTNISEDTTIIAKFQKCYDLEFDFNGGKLNGSTDASSMTMYNLYYNSDNTTPERNLPTDVPTREGYSFGGWSLNEKTYQAGASFHDIGSSNSYTASAIWVQRSVSFDGLNGATPSTISPLVGGVGDKVTLPAYNAATKAGYSIAAWKIGQENYAQNSEYELTSSNVTATAVWVSIKLRKRGTGADVDTNVNGVGSLYLLSSDDGYDAHILPTVGEADSQGNPTAWIFAPKPNTTYKVGCTMATTDPDKLWAFSGVTDTQGNALTEIAIDALLGNVTLNANFTHKTTKTIGTEISAVDPNDEDTLAGIVNLAVTTPSDPDVPQLGGEGKYITGQQIVATATYADGAMGWHISTARLVRKNDNGEIMTNDELKNLHVNADGYGTITVNPNQFDSNIVIVGIFDRVKCPLSANAHAASAHAFSAFTAQYLGGDGEWHNAVSSSGVVKYGEQVKLHVELADGGFQFEGLYVNGEKSALTPDENGDILYTLENALSFAFVVKAKVSVSMKVVHWADGAKTTGDCKVVLGGTASTGENPVVKDVTLGDTIAYGIDLAERVEGVDWLFDAWYNAVSGEQSYADPVALPISNDAFAPTAPVDVVARVIDEYILYKTTISFVNEETQDEITAQTDFVESPQEADEKFVNEDNELEFDYRRGAMSVTLNFKETLPGTQLLFTKIQQWLYDEQSGEYGWSDVYNEPSVGFMSNANRKLRALYGSAGNRTVSLAYANGSDRTMGDFFIAEAEGSGKTIEAPRGSQLTLRAVPANGYRFAGWYYAPQAIERIYESTEQVVTVKTTRTLYALFVQDTHAVYEWEGRSDNKMMTWRSKVYVAQVPFNPSAIRVDATDSRGRGTTVGRVEVGMMSSPDAVPAQSGLTVLQNMPNYVARRLPKRRPERYLYVEVQNDAEVDRIIVGTSMEGLRV